MGCSFSERSWLNRLCVYSLLALMFLSARPLPAADGEKCLEEGNAFLEVDEADKALEKFQQAKAAGLKTAELFNNQGYAYFLKGELKEAEVSYLKALEIYSASPVTHNNLGVLYHREEKYDLAVDAYLKALAVDPKHAKAAYNLAVAYYRQGKYLQAARQYVKAKKINREYGEQRFKKEKLINSVKEDLKKDPRNEELKLLLIRLQSNSSRD